MQTYGPLHAKRFEIVEALKSIPLQTGDILYRQGDARGPLNLPFSKLVTHLTKSKYSHASMVIMEGTEPFVLEIGENGTLELRLIDWLDQSVTSDLMVSRIKGLTPEAIKEIEKEMRIILEADADYDYTFLEEDKFYCTESVNYIAEKVGYPIFEPELIEDVVSPFSLKLFKTGNFFFKLCSGYCIPFDKKFYYIGNEKRGMMSSKALSIIYSHQS